MYFNIFTGFDKIGDLFFSETYKNSFNSVSGAITLVCGVVLIVESDVESFSNFLDHILRSHSRIKHLGYAL